MKFVWAYQIHMYVCLDRIKPLFHNHSIASEVFRSKYSIDILDAVIPQSVSEVARS